MICFLCRAEYDPTVRYPIVNTYDEENEEMTNVSCMQFRGKTLKLCPDCIRAAVFGVSMSGGVSPWDEGEIEYEEDEPPADSAPGSVPDIFTPFLDIDIPIDAHEEQEVNE